MYTVSALFDITVPFFVFAPQMKIRFRRPWWEGNNDNTGYLYSAVYRSITIYEQKEKTKYK